MTWLSVGRSSRKDESTARRGVDPSKVYDDDDDNDDDDDDDDDDDSDDDDVWDDDDDGWWWMMMDDDDCHGDGDVRVDHGEE